MSRHKDGDDGEEIIGELAGVVFVVLFAVYHEFRASLCKEEFHELDAEATEPVFVQHHNLLDQAFEDAFQ